MGQEVGLRTGLGQGHVPTCSRSSSRCTRQGGGCSLVIHSADLHPASSGWVPMTNKGTSNPGCISLPGMQMTREEATQTRAAENPHMILKAGVGCCPCCSRLLGTYPWCVATKYLTLNLPLGLAVAGCLHCLANPRPSLHLPRYLNHSFFPEPGS